jgi:hypothetical protein
MQEINRTILRLSRRLDTYHLPSEEEKALQVAQDMDSLLLAKDLINYYNKEADVKSEA